MSQNAQAMGTSVVFTNEDEVNAKTVSYAKAMLAHLLQAIEAPTGPYRFTFASYERSFASLTQRHMQLTLDAGDRLKVQIKVSHGALGAITGYLELPQGVLVHTVFQAVNRGGVLRGLNEDYWQEAIDSVPPEPPPGRLAPSVEQLSTHAGAAVTWSRTTAIQSAAAVPPTPQIPRHREATRNGGPMVASTSPSPAPPSPSPTNGRTSSMNAPMTDPTPTWVELLKSLLHGADRGVMKSAGAGQKATRFFPGKNARELAPTVFTELRKRGWVRLIDREKGFWQVEQAFVDQHRLGITIDVQPALDPLPRGKAAQKKQPSSPADELEQLMAQRQAEEQRIHVLIHAARQQLVDAITHAQQAMAEGIASAEQALNDARTTGAAAVAAAQAALAAHEKKFAKELKAAPPSAGKK